jgi:hypothetical protein
VHALPCDHLSHALLSRQRDRRGDAGGERPYQADDSRSQRRENVTDVDRVGTLKCLAALSRLSLGGCYRVTDVGVGMLSGLKVLSSLHLAFAFLLEGTRCTRCAQFLQHPNVTDVGMGTVSGFTALSTLNLSGCNVTDVGAVMLSGLTSLTDLLLDHLHRYMTDRRGCGVAGRPQIAIPSQPLRLPLRHRGNARAPHSLSEPDGRRRSSPALRGGGSRCSDEHVSWPTSCSRVCPAAIALLYGTAMLSRTGSRTEAGACTSC